MEQISPIMEILKNKRRCYEEEKELINLAIRKMSSNFNPKEIYEQLEKNGFNGLYLLTPKEYDMIERITINNPGIAMYSSDDKVIIFDKSKYLPQIGLHELGHAIIDNRSVTKLPGENSITMFGKGLEEGAITLLAFNEDVNNISKINKNYLYFQSLIFQQLDALYKESKIKEYSNLLIHFFKKPEEFNKVVGGILVDTYESIYKEDSIVALRTALHTINVTDFITFDPSLEIGNNLLNLLAAYGCLKFKNFKYDTDNTKPFIVSKIYQLSTEERLMDCVFSDNTIYQERVKEYIDQYLSLVEQDVEEANEKLLKP